MKRMKLLLTLLLSVSLTAAFAVGEAGTYFNIYVPPSAVSQQRDVSLTVTALFDSTYFRINDTGEDGDTDDSASGMLMAGQSYILYLRDNGVNDDAPHAGDTAAKQDGDHFLVTGTKLILVSQSVKSDWQHDWLPSVNKTMKGTQFFIYANETGVSPNDLNIMAYADSTYVKVWKISTSNTTGQGYTHVSMANDSLVAQFQLKPGIDIIYQLPYGRDILKPGETYWVQSNKDVTVQYGALYGDEQDGGGYVPSANGTGTGNLFYFPVPFEDSMQQEIRLVSWYNDNTIYIDEYNNGQWVTIKEFDTVHMYAGVEWVGKVEHATYASIFRVRCTSGKAISVFEGNWIETGGMLTSDISSMVPSSNGQAVNTSFSVYMPIPSTEMGATDPFTGGKLPAKATHAYIFGGKSVASTVKVVDAATGGNIINRTYTIPANYYADCMLDSAQWVSIYNNTGTTAGGPARPYLLITSNNPVSVEVNNFNDNWTMYFSASIPHAFDLTTTGNRNECHPGDTATYTTAVNLYGQSISGGSLVQTIDNGFKVLSTYLIDSTTRTRVTGTQRMDASGRTVVTYNNGGTFNATHQYRIISMVVPYCVYGNNKILSNHQLLTVQCTLSAGGDMAYSTTQLLIDSASKLAYTPQFTLSATSIVLGQNESFTASNYSGVTYNWDFGDNHLATGRTTSHVYQQTGNYTTQLKVTNNYGCWSANSKVVQVAIVHCNNNDNGHICGNSCTQTCHTTENENDQHNERALFTTDASNTEAEKTPLIWNTGNKISVNLDGISFTDGSIAVYNLLGQQLFADRLNESIIYSNSATAVASGYYIVNVILDEKQYTKKIFIAGGRSGY